MIGLRYLPLDPKKRRRVSDGFTLTELAIALVIIALALGGLVMTLSAQNEVRKFAETQARLETAREALIGFAVRNGRLPCPATATSNGVEAPLGGGTCSLPLNGFLPGATLGLPGGADGRVLDAWDEPIRYAVSTWVASGSPSSTFTTTSEMGRVGVTGLNPTLRLCSASTCAASERLTADNTVAAVVYSLGKNRLAAGLGADEGENQDNDNDFVSHEPRPSGAPGGEFDDLVTWLPLNTLVSRLVAAGVL
jgi:prepilin-type N-terminal cleavage/methylation domain-containing protein